MRCCMMVVVAFMMACGERAPQPAPPATAQETAADSARELEPDTVLSEYERQVWEQLLADAALPDGEAAALVGRLQPVADQSQDEATAAPALLRLAWLKLRLHHTQVDEQVVQRRPDDFAYFEIQGGHYSIGADLDSLAARFPASTLRDDAAYAATYTPRGGECEGYVPCYLAAGTFRLLEFMAAYPASRYVLPAVQRVNAHVQDVLEDVPDLRVQTDDYDVAEVRGTLARYDSISQRLPREARNMALETLEPVLRRLAADAEATVPPEPYTLVRQLGLYFGGGSTACVVMEEPRLEIGTGLLLVSVRQQDTVSARITSPLRRGCGGPSVFPPAELASYTIVLERPVDELSDGVAFTSYEPDVQLQPGRALLEIGAGGQVLTQCTSREGLHHYLRDASSGRELWHAYVSFGFDTEPTCPEPATDR